MDLYTRTAYQLSEQLTKNYSTSFSMSSRLFGKDIRPHIYAIYGLVRIADEIVDVYRGNDAKQQLDDLEADVMNAIRVGYSTNPIVHAFASTASLYHIDSALIKPFFKSMRMDFVARPLSPKLYQQYIYGSAEVVGLMCLKVFVNDEEKYRELRPGAEALGSAYQKVNFLRDMQADYNELGRVYFPGVDYTTFTEAQKQHIIQDIESDFSKAARAIEQLPEGARQAVTTSFMYYQSLLQLLKASSVEDIKQKRIRTSNATKLWLYLRVQLGVGSLRIG